ncbi:cysteine desulfurase family protein [Sporosarcina aquimarina]|uniref:Cysteine desulfurase family protein n=1 Tax=Sporosarcina aquimarina TaxID=114975 RepID=A0ABU4G1T2_9BACL|nr:cysteine desulfurase family protein [Sporosarcina aquimarina]MDW0110342.1 cysteine desulfurase family protein [Sporosarcina aquimarina]
MIYLDNCATTLPDEEVLNAFTTVNRTYFANPASLHQAGSKAEQLLESARKQIAELAGDPESTVIFTSGGTEADNLAIVGYARSLRHRGNHIITSEIEHDAVRNACLYLEKEGFEVDWLTVNEKGEVSPEELKQKLRKDTILVSIMHVNNEIGTIQPIEACSKVIRAHSRALFHSDCVQSIGKLPLPFPEWTDAISLSAHKIHGLKGTGCLVSKKFKTPEAISYGGGQESGFRSGTANVAGAVAFAKAMRLAVRNSESSMYKRWNERLREQLIPEKMVRICSPVTGAPHILTLAFKGITGEIAVNFFQEKDIIVSTSSACSSKAKNVSHVIEAIRIPDDYRKGVIRISFGKTNTDEEIEVFTKTMQEFLETIKKGMKQHDME